jgi:hypothetical protein
MARHCSTLTPDWAGVDDLDGVAFSAAEELLDHMELQLGGLDTLAVRFGLKPGAHLRLIAKEEVTLHCAPL